MAEKESSDNKRLPLSELLYYQKPNLGPVRRGTQKQPLQVTFPSGAYGIAIPSNVIASSEDSVPNDSVVIASESENDEWDIRERRWITAALLCVALVNLIITSLMFQDAHMVNPSNVVESDDANPLPLPFEVVPETRRYIENVFFAFLILSIIGGSVSAVMENVLGLSAYGLSVVIMYFCGTSAMPNFVFSFRSIFDIWMLYLALVLRSKLIFNLLPLRIRHAYC
jgi:hypothetical protein